MYVTKHKPWAHQIEALKKLEGKKFFALLMQMRTGKTKVCLDDFARLYDDDQVDDLLVIAPAGVYMTWIDAIKEHVGEPLASEIRTFAWISSKANGNRKAGLDYFLYTKEGPRAFFMNIEALSSVKGAREAVETFCIGTRVYCVIDESTCIKNPKSKRTQYVLDKIRYACQYRRILTGLVAPKDPLDVYSQFEFLDHACLGYSTFTSFSARYGIFKKRTAKHKGGFQYNFIKPVAFRDKEELANRMSWHSFRVKLSDCYDLPPKLYEIRNVELTDQQEKLYADMLKYSTAKLEEESYVTATHAMVEIIKLHQILMGHTKDEDGVEHFFEQNRIKSLMELIEEWDDGENKAIIWCAYGQDIANVYEALRSAGYQCARFWGGNRVEREEEEKAFKENPGVRFMIATASAGGRGRTWNNADLVVYYSNTHNLEHREQSEERAQIMGKDKNVLYVDLVALRQSGAKTVDMRILEALRQKINMSSVLMGDGWRKWLI